MKTTHPETISYNKHMRAYTHAQSADTQIHKTNSSQIEHNVDEHKTFSMVYKNTERKM